MQINTGKGEYDAFTQVMLGAKTLSALGATTKVIAMFGYPIPSTMVLKSADATRKIEFSVDGGVEYFTPAYDVTSATMLVAVSTAGLSHVKFTGLTGDTWSIA